MLPIYRVLISNLVCVSRNGTSFVSMYIPPKKKIDEMRNFLNDEMAQSDSIKSKQTRTSVQTAITSTLESKFNISISRTSDKTISPRPILSCLDVLS